VGKTGCTTIYMKLLLEESAVTTDACTILGALAILSAGRATSIKCQEGTTILHIFQFGTSILRLPTRLRMPSFFSSSATNMNTNNLHLYLRKYPPTGAFGGESYRTVAWHSGTHQHFVISSFVPAYTDHIYQ
jgi:hypothetical protein